MSTETQPHTIDRQTWMATLAIADTEQLMSLSETLIQKHAFEDIRTAEIGLAQVRGRMGGTGSPFNVGDMTITRCVTRAASGHYGHSYVAGRCRDHAQRAAELDALLQCETHYDLIIENVIKPLQQRQQQEDQDNREKTESTRVNFFTLVRGEDA